MSEPTYEICPMCDNESLVFTDDPNTEALGATGEWNCVKCGYQIDARQFDFDELFEDDDDDYYDGDDIDF